MHTGQKQLKLFVSAGTTFGDLYLLLQEIFVLINIMVFSVDSRSLREVSLYVANDLLTISINSCDGILSN